MGFLTKGKRLVGVEEEGGEMKKKKKTYLFRGEREPREVCDIGMGFILNCKQLYMMQWHWRRGNGRRCKKMDFRDHGYKRFSYFYNYTARLRRHVSNDRKYTCHCTVCDRVEHGPINLVVIISICMHATVSSLITFIPAVRFRTVRRLVRCAQEISKKAKLPT